MTYKEFIEKFGNEKVKFDSYFKYTFCFSNDDGLIIYTGGCAEDIYGIHIEADKEYIVSELLPNAAYLKGEDSSESLFNLSF